MEIEAMRSIVDKSCGSPERLVFEGAPIIKPPLVQEARAAITHESSVLDQDQLFAADARMCWSSNAHAWRGDRRAGRTTVVAEGDRGRLPDRRQLATLLLSAGSINEAVALREAALAAHDKVLGREHNWTKDDALGRTEEAQALRAKYGIERTGK